MELDELNFDLYRPQPLLIVISGTSGIGKDAVLQGLRTKSQGLHFVVTATSRLPRPNEVDGKDYFFFTREDFTRRIENGEFIEYAMVYEDYKGGLRSQVEDALRSGKDVVLRVDVQGAETYRRLYPEAILIFLIPNTIDEWYGRLKTRNTESPENLKVRIETAKEEVKKIGLFDYVVVNAENCLGEAVDDILSIIKVEHHKVHHRKLI
ncbi:MAG: guanylate kinase [Chloroflexi bacterium HGW-Chloroflexi-4]|jgi:guanylate kinase|nr:MAG: guanylate kinase [Chloroflexi bacterium HGW-Chloroflexi-7]PKO00143.1 MAG: guanylate kinase [Chloroflexi bacterium HGW-Chloroflexi-4]